MPSLRDKLNARASQAAPAAQRPQRVLEYTAWVPADAALRALSPTGLSRMSPGLGFDAERALFIDTETTGLSGGAGTVAFLVGLGRLEGDRFVVRQYLMSGYGAEPALLQKVCALAKEASALVSFNGRTFDIPLLRSRLVMCRMDDPLGDMAHLDLIYPARRVWKLRLKDCSLGHIEQSELNIRRDHDLPGADVPARYFEYLKSGDENLLTDVVDHNRQDIITLGTLLVRLCAAYADPLEQTSMMDVLSLGKTLQKQGDHDAAGKCYRLAGRARPLSTLERLRERHIAPDANRRLSLMLRSDKHYSEAEAVLTDMVGRGQMGIFPYVELSKLYEHRLGDPRRALDMTQKALAIADPAEAEALEKRRARLVRRISRAEEGQKGRP